MQAHRVSMKCRFCDILLVGREQFLGHMIHSHEMEYERLEAAWQSLIADCLNNDGHYKQPWHRGPSSPASRAIPA